jgi:hypothetical protein
VGDVVGVYTTSLGAAGEAAAGVAGAQRAAQRGRDRARLAPDRQRLPIAVGERDDRRVAADAPSRLGRQRRVVVELDAPAGAVGSERVRVDVDDDLVPIAARPVRRRRGSERGVGERDERVGVARSRGDAFAGRFGGRFPPPAFPRRR